jgi:hypothetical protein
MMDNQRVTDAIRWLLTQDAVIVFEGMADPNEHDRMVHIKVKHEGGRLSCAHAVSAEAVPQTGQFEFTLVVEAIREEITNRERTIMQHGPDEEGSL